MIHGLPLIHCLSEDARAKMLGKITDRDCLPDPFWEEWKKENEKSEDETGSDAETALEPDNY